MHILSKNNKTKAKDWQKATQLAQETEPSSYG